MEWWGPSQRLEFINTPETLVVHVTHLRRKGDLIVPASAAVFCVASIWFELGIVATVSSAIILLTSLFRWFSERMIQLSVNDKTLEVRSDAWWKTNVTRVHWSEIKRLEYMVGGDDEPSGLYAKQASWSRTCLLSDINEKTTAQIVDAIYMRFPFVEMAPDNGRRPSSGLITLGLSSTESKPR